MAIDVEIFGQLLPPERPRRQSVNVKEPETALELALSLGLDPAEIGLVTINGIQSSLDDRVQPGSRLCFFPYVTGG